MRRTIQPELLDSMSPDDPAARASRRDLRLINRLMGNFGWFAGRLRSAPPSRDIIELGAGDGGLGMYLHSCDIPRGGAAYTGIDLIARPADWPARWGWQQGDLLDAEFGAAAILLANLILHQFTDDDLAGIGASIASSGIRILLLNEPVRRPLHLWQMSLARLLRFHPVTYHDARASIRAGFRGNEAVRLLGLERKGWTFTHSETFMGANRIIGYRK
jgi:hypothetical protein